MKTSSEVPENPPKYAPVVIRGVRITSQSLLAKLHGMKTTVEMMVERWIVTTQQDMHDSVNRILNERFNDVVAQVLGLKRDGFSGRWEVNYTNGNKSIMSEWLSNRVRIAVEDYLDKNVASKVQVEPAMEKVILNTYKTAFAAALKEQAIASARAQALPVISSYLHGYGSDNTVVDTEKNVVLDIGNDDHPDAPAS